MLNLQAALNRSSLEQAVQVNAVLDSFDADDKAAVEQHLARLSANRKKCLLAQKAQVH